MSVYQNFLLPQLTPGSQSGQGSGGGIPSSPTLQFWHIPPMKRGCSRVTLRLPQEMQMSGKQRKQSERHCRAPSCLGPDLQKSYKKGACWSCLGQQGGTGAPISEALSSLRASMPPSRDRNRQGERGPALGMEVVLGRPYVMGPCPVLPRPEGPEPDTPSLGQGRQTWDANDHWMREGDERCKARRSGSGKFN